MSILRSVQISGGRCLLFHSFPSPQLVLLPIVLYTHGSLPGAGVAAKVAPSRLHGGAGKGLERCWAKSSDGWLAIRGTEFSFPDPFGPAAHELLHESMASCGASLVCGQPVWA